MDLEEEEAQSEFEAPLHRTDEEVEGEYCHTHNSEQIEPTLKPSEVLVQEWSDGWGW